MSQKNELNKKLENKETSEIKDGSNILINEKQDKLNIFSNNIIERNDQEKKEKENDNIDNKQKIDEFKDEKNNINEIKIKTQSKIDEQTNIVHSASKYIKKSQVIEEESVRNSTLHNQTNTPNNTIDNKDKFYTNTGDSVRQSQNQIFNSNINNNTKFSILENPMKEMEFINKIKERDENILLNKNKNLPEIEVEYESIKLKNLGVLEKKEENLIKQKQNKYYNDSNKNLEKEDYKNIIKNIIEDNKQNLENDKIYKEFFDNLIQKNELSDLLPQEMNISKLGISNINETHTKSKFVESNNLKENDLTMTKSLATLKKLEKKVDDDFL